MKYTLTFESRGGLWRLVIGRYRARYYSSRYGAEKLIARYRRMRVTAEQQNVSDSADFDLYLYMANVKTHLADHQPMDDGDEGAWWIADLRQEVSVNAEFYQKSFLAPQRVAK